MFKLRERADRRVDQVLSAHARSEAKEEELQGNPPLALSPSAAA